MSPKYMVVKIPADENGMCNTMTRLESFRIHRFGLRFQIDNFMGGKFLKGDDEFSIDILYATTWMPTIIRVPLTHKCR